MSKSYLDFTPVPSNTKTQVWEVCSPSAFLGNVKFRPQWRKYVFEPTTQIPTVYDAGCLHQIAHFCEVKTKEWRDSL